MKLLKLEENENIDTISILSKKMPLLTHGASEI